MFMKMKMEKFINLFSSQKIFIIITVFSMEMHALTVELTAAMVNAYHVLTADVMDVPESV